MLYTNFDFNGKKILITGGAGFIGSSLASHLQVHYPNAQIVVFDSFRNGEILDNGNLKSFGHFKNLIGFRGEILTGDLNRIEDIKKLYDYGFDFIFHQAAISDTTIGDQALTLRTNLNTFKEIIHLAQSSNANLVYASSGATYGNALSPQTVGIENPQNVYGFSKLMMDNLTYKTIDSLGDSTMVGLRYFNVYGAREFYKNKTASMVLQLGLQILDGKNPKLFEGSNAILRDFVYIEDVIQANIKAATAGVSGVFNVGTGEARSFEEIATTLLVSLGSPTQTIDYMPNPYVGRYQFHTQANIDTTRDLLSYKPHYLLELGIKDYIDEIKRIHTEEYHA